MDAMRNAYVEHGGLVSGACALASDGTLYSGCTVDHPVTALSLPAEMVAMVRAVSEGKREFDALAVVADIEGLYTPDEYTYEFLQELEVPELILADMDGNVKVMKLEDVVPYKPRRKQYD